MKRFNELYESILKEQKESAEDITNEVIQNLLDRGWIKNTEVDKTYKEMLAKVKSELNENKQNGKSAAYDIKRELILMAAKQYKISAKETRDLLAHLERTTK